MSVNMTVASTRSGSWIPREPVDELLDLVEQRVGVAGEVDVIVAGQLDVAGARDVVGQVATVGDVDQPVAATVQDQRRDADRRAARHARRWR